MIFPEAGKEYKTMIPGLDRIKLFLRKSGTDLKKVKYIHIAGTNGKGSTAKMIAAVLEKSGYKTGLYVSPHLVKINERISINSVYISDKDLKSLDKKYGKLSKQCGLTYFEHLTALAFIYFVQNKTDICVLETGLGGRYDATNVINPLVSIITSIGSDHTEVLGKSLSEIAFEKAGIIKSRVPVICGNIKNAAYKTIKKYADEKKAGVYLFGRDFSAKHINNNWSALFQNIQYKGLSRKLNINLNLFGKAQVYNLAAVLAVCELLEKKKFYIDWNNLNRIFENIKWHARFEIVKSKINNKNFTAIIDGAHNLQAADNFIKLYRSSPYCTKNTKLVFAVMEEKKYKGIIKKFACEFKKIYLLKPDNLRAVESKILKREFAKYIDIKDIKIFKSPEHLFKNIKSGDIIVCAGSFFLAGNIIKYIEDNND